MDATILSVRQLTEKLRHTLEQRFPYVWVKGEVTNLSRPSSGHVYFSLKEGDALLASVWFRGNQQAQEHFDPLTGEVWEGGPRKSLAHSLENGKEIVCAGRLSVYAPRGSYQLVVELAQEIGLGQWHLAFAALKEKLAGMGWFSLERKRPVPDNPGRVALITATTGAAIQDFIRISSERGLGSTIRIYPTPVQGEDAPPRIVAALEQACRDGWAEVAVLIRGGGSIQDLWAFNDERVAEAVFRSSLPVLTGVGHEIDHSIADFVADLSAATPSHAAQLLWTERETFAQRADDMESALVQSMDRYLARHAKNLSGQESAMRMLSPSRRLKGQEESLNQAHARLVPAMSGLLARRGEQLGLENEALSRLGQSTLKDGELKLQALTPRIAPAAMNLLRMRELFLDKAELRMAALNPSGPLERGFALVYDADGALLSGVASLKTGDPFSVEMHDGRIAASVQKISKA